MQSEPEQDSSGRESLRPRRGVETGAWTAVCWEAHRQLGSLGIWQMEKYTDVRLSTKHRERWKRQPKLLSQWFIWCLKSIRQSHLMNLERSRSSCHLLRPPLVSPRFKWREDPVRNPEERHCSPSISLSSIPTMEIKSSECGTAWLNSILLNSLMKNWIWPVWEAFWGFTGMPLLPCLVWLVQDFRWAQTKAVEHKTHFLLWLFWKFTSVFDPCATWIPCLRLQPPTVHNMLISHVTGAL